jgi:hypothetical protein
MLLFSCIRDDTDTIISRVAVSQAFNYLSKTKLRKIKMINLNRSVEHSNPDRQGLDVEKYSLGWFDGLTGSDERRDRK